MYRTALRWAGLVAAVVLVAGTVTYLRDTRRAYDRVSGKATIIESPYGPLEYTEGGRGPAVLVVHGGGGGWDQGELLVGAILGDDFHWIAPSRFGYLGSAMPPDATWDDQADAFAYLLDQLGMDRVAVVALSQGGPSALLLALRHPDRVSSLTCLSCGVAPSTSTDQAQANRNGDMLRFLFARDHRYWAVSKFLQRPLMGVLGADRDVVAALTEEQQRLVGRLIDEMNPAAPRAAGVVLDNEGQLPGARIARIATPTLIVHARDDLLQLYHNAEFAATMIPGARLLSFESGGHVLVLVEQDAIRAAVREHILSNSAVAEADGP